MPQLPIQSGVAVKDGALAITHPLNLRHKVLASGISQGQLVAAPGALYVGTGPGAGRGGIAWREEHYRVMGSKLCKIAADGAITQIGDVGGDVLACRFAYGFDRLGIASGDALFYYDGSTLTQVTDTDLGRVVDLDWIDGYFVTTDGEYIVVTQLNDPAAVDPLKYGSAEKDPDAVTGVAVLDEELLAFGTNSIQFFKNVGGNGFPFANVPGAVIEVGCISAIAKCKVAGTIAFVGSGREDPLGIYVIASGQALRISDETVDAALAACGDRSLIMLEARRFGDEQQLVAHIGRASYCLSFGASQQASAGLWHRLVSKGGAYRPRNAVWVHGKHWVEDGASHAFGTLSEAVTAHFGHEPGWEFDAGLIYNDGRSFILRELEVVGQFPQTEGSVFMAITRDGELWSKEVSRYMTGDRESRALWRPNVRASRLAGFRFRGHGRVAISRCDAMAEALGV